ncbi:hypothetical protein MKI84_08130 [Ancylobacter sp. A5.8]|uniref:hypothetical protein n=1 Tax=Ancylobacter gelatini TaxID=2919920 RepID=UPI001F4DF186|nr:hypothetical protein [Ancylobacter gelatini]MCJ8142881.1 hypothetical protein [Ancylobacter gelatini]
MQYASIAAASREPKIIIRYSLVVIVAMVLLYFAIVFGLRGAFSDTAGSDSSTVKQLAESGSFEDAGSYAMTAFIYSITPPFLRHPFIYATGVAYIIFALRTANDRYSLAIVSFLLIMPMLTAIGTFQKDLLLVWFTLPVAYIFRSNATLLRSIIFYIIIYSLYAYYFRKYFFLIMFITFIFYVFFAYNYKFKMMAVFVAIAVLLLVPTDVLYQLQIPRDRANFVRLIEGVRGVRTAFLNPYPIDSLWHFMLNYLNAFWMLDFSLISRGFSIREAFLTLNVVVYIFAMWRGLIDKDPKIKFLGAMIAGHFFLIHVFEPDSGSYLRHLSASLLYVTIIVSKFSYEKRLKYRRAVYRPVRLAT